MVLLAGQAPEHLLAAGRLRLEQLAAFADPPMTKDAVAGRLRRLLSHTDRHSTSTGVPPTQTTPRARAAQGRRA